MKQKKKKKVFRRLKLSSTLWDANKTPLIYTQDPYRSQDQRTLETSIENPKPSPSFQLWVKFVEVEPLRCMKRKVRSFKQSKDINDKISLLAKSKVAASHRCTVLDMQELMVMSRLAGWSERHGVLSLGKMDILKILWY